MSGRLRRLFRRGGAAQADRPGRGWRLAAALRWPRRRRTDGPAGAGGGRDGRGQPGPGFLSARFHAALRQAAEELPFAGPKPVTTLVVEHGFIKLVVSQGPRVLDFRIAPANSSLFREGLVSSSPNMAVILRRTLEDMPGEHRRVIGAVPGYQTTLQRLHLPKAKGLDPAVAIPREAQRTMGVSPDRSMLAWRRVADRLDTTSWLVLSATRRSVASLLDTAARAGATLSVVELRPFALARAVNHADAIVIWVAADGCEAVVVRDWLPLGHQAAYWGAEPAVEGDILVNRMTEVVERAIGAHDDQNPETLVPEDLPVVVVGSPIRADPRVPTRLAANLGRRLGEPDPPLSLPHDFPIHDLIVNLGLALWEA